MVALLNKILNFKIYQTLFLRVDVRKEYILITTHLLLKINIKYLNVFSLLVNYF